MSPAVNVGDATMNISEESCVWQVLWCMVLLLLVEQMLLLAILKNHRMKHKSLLLLLKQKLSTVWAQENMDPLAAEQDYELFIPPMPPVGSIHSGCSVCCLLEMQTDLLSKPWGQDPADCDHHFVELVLH